MMAVSLPLVGKNVNNRHLHLFDTFEGMPKPGPKDVDRKGNICVEKRAWTSRDKKSESSNWANGVV